MEISAEFLRDRIASSMRRREDLDKECEENIKRMTIAEKKAYDEAVDEAMLIRNIERTTGEWTAEHAKTIAEPQRLALRYTEKFWNASHVGQTMIFYHARGLTLLSTEEELESQSGSPSKRKVYAARGDIVPDKPAQIASYLSGGTRIRTDAEVDCTLRWSDEELAQLQTSYARSRANTLRRWADAQWRSLFWVRRLRLDRRSDSRLIGHRYKSLKPVCAPDPALNFQLVGCIKGRICR
jgi:hypothetical protein